MAKDVSNKLVLSNNNADATSSSISDQQKVPPLRICLNTGTNQKSSSTATPTVPPNQQQDLKREKPRDSKTSDSSIKTGGRVRIRLGTNKQNNSGKSGSNEQNSKPEDGQKGIKEATSGEQNLKDSSKEEANVIYSHLRRITRRSNRTVQAVSNEDEESISSMTSTDEYQNIITNNSGGGNTHNSDSNSAQGSVSNQQHEQQNASTSAITTVTSTTSNTTTSNSETPRRKRRKGETSESFSYDHESLFGLQNYRLPHQNSFELFKNIRKQVDKKLKSLNSIHPRTPYGFRDYMLNKGAYLLDGNKLGNGATLFKNENGGMFTAPMGKYHALRHNKVNYMVPDRAKVPSVIPLNSPLYGLFIDQEKERYRMRMQHTKEREKLTLAAEQEIMRVYNQAALAAANQNEPFSACTMLKHQEIYNYLDSDGALIQTREDAQQDRMSKPDGVRTRRRQHERISPTPTRKNSNSAEETNVVIDNGASKEDNNQTTGATSEPNEKDGLPQQESKSAEEAKTTIESETGKTEDSEANEVTSDKTEKSEAEEGGTSTQDRIDESKVDVESATTKGDVSIKTESNAEATKKSELEESEPYAKTSEDPRSSSKVEKDPGVIKTEPPDAINDNSKKVDASADDKKEASDEKEPSPALDDSNKEQGPRKEDNLKVNCDKTSKSNEEEVVPMEQDSAPSQQVVEATGLAATESAAKSEQASSSDEDPKGYDKDVFLSQLQEVDDKWDKIRREMLIRHRNESESLHAIQKLEWEWKTKEIGTCDVRTTPMIDDVLVPKLDVFSQDY